MKKIVNYTVLVLLVLFIGFPLLATGIDERLIPAFLSGTSSATVNSKDEIAQNMQRLELLYRLVERDFLFDIDHKAVYESMAKGLFTGLDDEYSAYIISKEAADFSEDTTGVYGGIGAYISKNYLEYRDFSNPSTYMVNINSVFPNSPAEVAGLRSGDLISHIDGEAVDDWQADEASKALKGPPDAPVVLTVIRGNSTFDLKVIRKIVSVPTVSVDWLPKDIFYLRITQFTTKTAEQVRTELQKALSKEMKGLVLDLRENPGGIVEATLSIADMLLDEKVVVHVKGKQKPNSHTYYSSLKTLVPLDIPIALLVNKGSASSSEILAGALKDNGRATLIGSTTFGKGLIQIVSPFGDGYYTVTTSQYQTPNGSDIHKVGIPVDIEVHEPHIGEDEIDSYSEFIGSKKVESFVEEHPEFSDENVQLFLDTVVGENPPLEADVYTLLLRREYLANMSSDERPIADYKYDKVLKRALEFLDTGM
ncbi:MAG: S41 family peptidase [Candidatus Cloacimonetes bacterium]|nr:S41 family peptidase [Candidatus Cloacimonadota bacterium]